MRLKREESKLREWEERQSGGGSGGRLREKKQGKGQEGEGVETEQKKKKKSKRERETGMRPNAGPHECFRAVVKQASSHPTY